MKTVNAGGIEIAIYPVTQCQWQEVMGYNPSYFKGEHRPVESVTWHECQEFCKKAGFRLPTKAEWLKACVVGETKKIYNYGEEKYKEHDNYGDYAWWNGNAGEETHDVVLKEPNDYGLYDVFGNVWEWCEDKTDFQYPDPNEDKYGNIELDNDFWIDFSICKNIMGGSFQHGGWKLHSEEFPHNKRKDLGFRVIR